MNQIDLAQTIEEWRDLQAVEEEGPVRDLQFFNSFGTQFFRSFFTEFDFCPFDFDFQV